MRKMRIYMGCFLLAAGISFSSVSVFAEEDAQSDTFQADLGIPTEGYAYVSDRAGILDDDDREELEELAQSVTQQYECGVYIVTVDDYFIYSTESVYEAAKFIYQSDNMGYGDEKSGELLLLSMNDRDYSLIAYGYGNTAFTDYGKEQLEESFLDDFADDDWYEGFSDYINTSAEYLQEARNGNPVDINSVPEPGWVKPLAIVFSALLGFIIALITSGVLKSSMKSVRQQSSADSYVAKNGVKITKRNDQFLHRTVTRHKIEKHSDGGGGGGGTTVDSGGFSGSSGKF